jgi:PhzF family phenazine biosynthesis protein
MSQSVIVVDAFTDKPFAGNPAAVCVLEQLADETWMRHVAAEMNLSETAFLHPEADGWRLRWLTPTVEVDLCGHATLASAHVLWETKRLQPEQTANFHTRSGRLTATRRGDAIALDFPAKPPKECAPPDGLLSALGVAAQYVGLNGMDYFVEVADEDAVRAMRPDFGQLAKLPVRGVIVTGRPTTTVNIDFVSRFFAPGAGIPEDPVTGSAHCSLAPYWSAKLGKKELRGYQASTRGGYVGIAIHADRVQLIGNAVTVLRAELLAMPK